jgi:hypothetical protein
MKFSGVGLRNTFLFAFAGGVFAACGGGADSSSSGAASVDAAYAALVGDVAKCAKQVDGCLSAAGSDSAANDQCRAQFTTCRDSAGARAENSLAAAVTACTSAHRECAKAAQGTDASVGECKDELRTCLSAAHPQRVSDDDAGVDESGGKGSGKGKDCLADLHSCVEADGKAGECAHEVRSCVASALPSADVVSPKQAKDADEASDEGKGKPADAGKPSESSKPEDAGKPADPGSIGKARADEARKCVKSFSGCVEAGSKPQDCVSALKECKGVVEP